MSEWMALLAVAAFGLLLGVATLPVRAQLRHTGPVMYVIGVAAMWPILIPVAVWLCLMAYRDAWWRYSDFCAREHADEERVREKERREHAEYVAMILNKNERKS